ncbi:MAG: hypothetical protein J0L69_07705 [Bacteroidetes bacterium]|nr:hypothetical protein [Bacteroidota bacterium]
MKTKTNNNIVTATILILFALTIYSCKKHTCECVATRPTYNPGDGPTTTIIYFKGRKARAKSSCESLSEPPDTYGNETKCVLK